MNGERLRRLYDRLRAPGTVIGLLVLLGLVLRAFGYLRNPSVWHDEAALILNVIGKNYADLLGPLDFTQAAPPLFLWAERAIVLLLGDGTYALRLLPFVAACAALLLFVPVARGLLCPAAVPWAVLLFAFNDHLLWHASEVKPYSIDVLTAAALLALGCRTRGWPLERRLLLGVPLAPLAIWLAYPGCFLCGGVMLALLPALWRARERWTAWLAYGAATLSMGAAFLLLYRGAARAQHSADLHAYWTAGFPPWDGPAWAVPVWLVKSTFDVLTYCCSPSGGVLGVPAAVGVACLWRDGKRKALLLLLAPAGLALAAACTGGYPYCGTRIQVYLTPAVVLLIAAGIPPALDWLRARTRLGTAALVIVLLAAVGTVAHNTAVPYGRPDLAGASRWVLPQFQPGDVVTGKGCEHAYYFRRLGPAFVPGGRVTDPPAGRVWLVVTAATRETREATWPGMAPAGWEPRQRREFYRTTVLLLRPTEHVAEGPHE